MFEVCVSELPCTWVALAPRPRACPSPLNMLDIVRTANLRNISGDTKFSRMDGIFYFCVFVFEIYYLFATVIIFDFPA